MIAGYAATAAALSLPALPTFAWQLLNGVGDLFQIIPAVEKKHRVDWASLSRPEARLELRKAGHCSALIKVVGDLSELFMGHSSCETHDYCWSSGLHSSRSASNDRADRVRIRQH